LLLANCFTQIDLDVPQLLPFCGGDALLYTHRAPNKNAVNEDCVALIPYNPSSGILVIADGLGGLPNGETASKTAIHSIIESTKKASKSNAPLREAILDGIETANQNILEQTGGAATTLALIEIQNNTVRPYHVGDSMIMVCGQRGKIKLQSIAHSPIGYAVESGLLDQDEAIHHKERHLISNVVGANDMNITIGSIQQLDVHDTVIIASDGLFDNLYLDEITEIIRKGDLAKSAKSLLELAQGRMNNNLTDLPCHPDDLTFILFRHH